MPAVIPMKKITQVFDSLFEQINEHLFYGKITKPIFRVIPSKAFVFRFEPSNNEIVIGSGLVKLKEMDILIELFREMIHIHNYELGVSDRTINQYYNKDFARSASRIGFYVQKHLTRGWCNLTFEEPTSGVFYRPTKDSVDSIKLLFFQLSFGSDGMSKIKSEIKDKKNKKQSQLKYICGCDPPHNTIRCGRGDKSAHPLRARCEICNHPYKLEIPEST